MNSGSPPKILWGYHPSGQYPEGSLAKLEVRIVKDPQGQMWSVHSPLTPADQAVFESWPGHGVRDIAHALLVEALRREAYLCVLMEMTTFPGLLHKYDDPTCRNAEFTERTINEAVQKVLDAVAPKIIPNVVKEILDMVAKQDGKDTKRP